ncbi:hypothetical protein F4703DRAFT_1744109 [Phycomyces blakesleeanus]
MINKLRSRSLIGNVFASQLSLTNKTFDKRDINDDDFEKPDGSTRADLSTSVEDLKDFLRRYIINIHFTNHKNAKKIIVYRFLIKAEMEVFEREPPLLDQDAINKFDCRRRLVKRFL